MAEYVMKDLVSKAGLSEQFEIASAATSAWEIGNPVYPPARQKLVGQAENRGFAAAAGTDKCGNGMVCNLHIYIFQCVVLSVMEI